MAARVALVTGAASGIGRALASVLAREGYALELADVDPAVIQVAEVGGGVGTELDVSDRGAVETYAGEVMVRRGHVDLIVNNAGITVYDTVEHTPYADFERVMAVNFWGTVYVTRAFLPGLLERGGGHVVNVGSVFGLIGSPLQAAYSASKFAVRGFTECLRQELAETAIAVSLVIPGGIRTEITRRGRRGEATIRGRHGETRFRTDFERFERSSAEEAARTIAAGIQARRGRILVGADAHLIDGAQRLFPDLHQHLGSALARRRR